MSGKSEKRRRREQGRDLKRERAEEVAERDRLARQLASMVDLRPRSRVPLAAVLASVLAVD